MVRPSSLKRLARVYVYLTVSPRSYVPLIFDSSRRPHSPGLTSKGGYLTPGLKVGQPVAIFAEGKETPCAIGIMKMTTEDIQSINKGHGIENVTYLGDDLWTNAKDF